MGIYVTELIIVHKEIISHNRVIKYIRADDQFVTSDIQAWWDNCTPQIKIFPCISHKHQQIGKVERFNQKIGLWHLRMFL